MQSRIFLLVLIALLTGLGLRPAAARADGPPADNALPSVGAPIDPAILEGFKALKKSTRASRRPFFELIADKGDARLIAALTAYKNGMLLNHNGQLAIYGPRTNVDGRGEVLPLVDAFTYEPIKDETGKPLYYAKPDLKESVGSPLLPEKRQINDLLLTLSINDPDPKRRTEALLAAADRADAALLPAIMQQRAKASEDMQPVLDETIASINLLNGTQDEKLAAATVLGDTGRVRALSRLQKAAAPYNDRLSLEPALQQAAAALGDPQAPADSKIWALETINAKSDDAALKGAVAPVLTALKKGQAPSTDAVAALQPKVQSALSDVQAWLKHPEHKQLYDAINQQLGRINSYQGWVGFLQNTFSGLSTGSILILLALGLSIIFGLMGVINMAHGEFMMIGAFTTFVVAEFFKNHFPGAFDYYLIAAIPAAFLVAALFGLVCEMLVIRHLYGRPLETLLATWGLGLILIQAARVWFGDNQSVTPPAWLDGGFELLPDLILPLNRLFIVGYCAACIAAVYLVISKTRLGLLLRATTQIREMAAASGVATRRIDAMTFALGAGLAGLAGVVVPLYNKINPSIGREYVVDSFMVVVVGGVGALAGAIWAGLGLGFLSKYLEPLLQNVDTFASSASVLSKVLVLALIIAFLQWRPAGLFPPRGRLADA